MMVDSVVFKKRGKQSQRKVLENLSSLFGYNASRYYKRIISKHLQVPQKQPQVFFIKETRILKTLMLTYPNVDFWMNTKFRPIFVKSWNKEVKLLSFSQLSKWPFNEPLEKQYKQFHFKVENFADDTDLCAEKIGEDILINKKRKRTMRNFLNA